MTEPKEGVVHRTEQAATYYRPEDIQEMFGIKKVAYYNRLKFLEIEANKDEQGKPYLDAGQVELLKALHEHINETGKMEGFVSSQNGGLVKVDRNGLGHSNKGKLSPENIYVEPEEPVDNSELGVLLREAEELRARELAMRDLIKRKLADQMGEEDLPPDLQEKVRLAREAANPKFTPQEVATTLLQQWRARHNNG
jgi:hypothetical protein